MNLCIHCRHFRLQKNQRGDDAICARAPVGINMVTGEKIHQWCEHERLDDSRRCGPSGRYFEAKVVEVAR